MANNQTAQDNQTAQQETALPAPSAQPAAADTAAGHTDWSADEWQSWENSKQRRRTEALLRGTEGMTSKEILDSIMVKIEQFQGSAEQHDDITMVAIRVTE